MTIETAVSVEGVSARIGGRRVLDGVDLSIDVGEVVALFGHNGAGKSTLLRCILGIIPIEDGLIKLGFARWSRHTRSMYQAGISYLPQREKLFLSMTVEDNLRVYSYSLGFNRRQFEMRYSQVSELLPIIGAARTTLANRLSGGEGQQVAIARALLGCPRLLLLDEPGTGLAPHLRKSMFAAMRNIAEEFSAGVCLVEHRIMEALAVSHRAYVMRLGKVADSSDATTLLNDPQKLRTLVL